MKNKRGFGKPPFRVGLVVVLGMGLFIGSAMAVDWDGTLKNDPRGGTANAVYDGTPASPVSSGATVNIFDYDTAGFSADVAGNVYGGIGTGDVSGNTANVFNSGAGNGGTGQSVNVAEGSLPPINTISATAAFSAASAWPATPPISARRRARSPRSGTGSSRDLSAAVSPSGQTATPIRIRRTSPAAPSWAG